MMAVPIQPSDERASSFTAETVGMGADILDRMERAVAKVRDRLLRATAALNAAGVPYAVVGGNAVVLAIFGTLQKLLSNGLFFGAVPSPNARFFATFVYGNHWAAFAVLAAATASGRLFRHLYRHDGSPRAQGKSALGIVGILLIAITPVIAGSRAGTLMMAPVP